MWYMKMIIFYILNSNLYKNNMKFYKTIFYILNYKYLQKYFLKCIVNHIYYLMKILYQKLITNLIWI